MSEWISVDERLPAKHKEYLVYRTTPFGELVGMAYFKLKKKRAVWYQYDRDFGFYEIEGVTHWMPLPEAPKERRTI